jgi:uncharacterized protein YdeI (YjbR/CyaY-like superfamily)
MTPKSDVSSTADVPIISFQSANEWEAWLAKNHGQSAGIWLRFYRKDSGKQGVTYPEVLDGALCYGWIDGQLKPYDKESWLRKFTPRRPRSVWSKRNTEHVVRLTGAGRMKRAGLREVEAAKADGRWERGYDSPAKMSVPDDFLSALSKNKKAKAFFATLNKANRYAIAWRLATAVKPETREKRFKAMIGMLARGEAFH